MSLIFRVFRGLRVKGLVLNLENFTSGGYEKPVQSRITSQSAARRDAGSEELRGEEPIMTTARSPG